MDKIEVLVNSLKCIRPHVEDVDFELVFSFSTQSQADEYYLDIYHWECHHQMIKRYTEATFLSGFKFTTELNAKALKYLTHCYINIASNFEGDLCRWKLWINMKHESLN